MLVFVSIADKKILLVDVQTDSIRQRLSIRRDTDR